MQDLRRDFIYGENDVFFIQLDPQNLQRYCMSFQTTPLGSMRDAQVFDDRLIDSDWDALWNVRTSLADSGYYAEFVIPFKTLRYELNEGDSVSWGLTFSRLARRNYEQTVFPAIPQAFSPYRMTYAAELKGLELPKPSANVRIQPYVLTEVHREENPTSDGKANFDYKIGGDVKWAINPHSVLDLTINTDFAQAEVDRAVNNLERFNVFFPERRQFFLENSGIWASTSGWKPIQPFFSRSIGLDGEFNATPLQIYTGARYVDRKVGRTIGGLYVLQEAGSNTGQSHFAVGRYTKNYGKRNSVGVMVTHRQDQADSERQIEERQNSTFTVDGLIRPKEEITFRYLVSGSRHQENGKSSFGSAGYTFLGYSPNNLYLGWETSWVSQNYLSTMGFVFQENVINHNPGGYLILRPKRFKWIRRLDPGIFVDYFQNASDFKFQQANLYIFPIYLFFTDGSFLEWAIYPTWQNINFDFRPLDIPIEQQNYFYNYQRIRFNTDRSKKLSLSGNFRWGGYYNGKLTTYNVGTRIAPIPHISLGFNFERNSFEDVGIEEVSRNVDLFSTEVRLAANPNWLLSAFYQYNTFDETGRWNIRGSWQFSPLSFVYLVLNQNSFTAVDEHNQDAIFKIAYTKQF